MLLKVGITLNLIKIQTSNFYFCQHKTSTQNLNTKPQYNFNPILRLDVVIEYE